MNNSYEPPLKIRYFQSVRADLQKELQLPSIMSVPRLEKILLSAGVGEAIQNGKILSSIVNELSIIANQRAVKTKSKKSIANFKLRKGMEIGAKVTLRGDNMYDFLSRLINIALPRVKDFQGLNPDAFDGHGNYTLGISEQIIFPEINYDSIFKICGFNVTLVTTALTDRMGKELLTKLGLPFKRKNNG